MNGCRGGSAAATGCWAAGAPMNRSSELACGPSGIGACAAAGAAEASSTSVVGSPLRRNTPRSYGNVRWDASGGLGRGRVALVGRLGDERRLDAALDRLLGHDALLDVAAGRQLELDLEQDLLDDRAQAAGAGLALQRAVGYGLQRVLGEDQLDPVEAEEALELLDDRVARLGEDRDQVLARELVHGARDGEAADELRDQAVLHEVLGEADLEQLARVLLGLGRDRRAEADALVTDPALDDLVEVRERAAADEQHVRRVDREELLVRVLAPALRRHGGRGALEDLQQRLLNALTGHVARDRRV